MTPVSISIEDYVGAIYRMQNKSGGNLPLGDLQEFFGFSPISIHEMVQKLVQRGLAEYQPYRGVKLTSDGNVAAEALIRRHRIWECFLSNELQVPLDEAHQLAGDLEHAAPDWMTERLFTRLGKPEFCPHGSKIGESNPVFSEIRIKDAIKGQFFIVSRIYPEKELVLTEARKLGIHPGQKIELIQNGAEEVKIKLDNLEVLLTGDVLSCIWGMVNKDES